MTEVKMTAPDIHPTLAEDVERSAPPPSYEEVLGQFVTSVSQTQAELPALSYIDIMPRLIHPGNMKENIPPVFEKFSDIMRGANFWLKNNPGLLVWKCETVERKVEQGPMVHLDNTVHHESSFGANYYVFGVRLWLTRRLDSKEGVQELGLLNVPPPVKEIPIQFASRGFGIMGMGMGVQVMPMMRFRRPVTMVTQGMFQTYEGLSKAVDDFNEETKTNPLEGYILNVESTWVKFGDDCSGDTADPDVTSWSEKDKGKTAFSTRRFTKILRVFYVKGPARKETLQMTTILPEVIKQPDWTRPPVFEKWDQVLFRLQQWLQTQHGVRIVNIETREAKCLYGFGQPVTVEHDSTDEFVTSFKDDVMARYIRVFYVSAPDAPPYQSTTLTSRLFVPVGLGGRRYESMTQTMYRINSWLSMVGQHIFSVETVPFLLGSSGSPLQTDRTDYKKSSNTGNYWLTCVRLYFPAPFQEPPAHLLPRNQSSQSSSCTIL